MFSEFKELTTPPIQALTDSNSSVGSCSSHLPAAHTTIITSPSHTVCKQAPPPTDYGYYDRHYYNRGPRSIMISVSIIPYPSFGECCPSSFLCSFSFRLNLSSRLSSNSYTTRKYGVYNRESCHPVDSLETWSSQFRHQWLRLTLCLHVWRTY